MSEGGRRFRTAPRKRNGTSSEPFRVGWEPFEVEDFWEEALLPSSPPAAAADVGQTREAL